MFGRIRLFLAVTVALVSTASACGSDAGTTDAPDRSTDGGSRRADATVPADAGSPSDIPYSAAPCGLPCGSTENTHFNPYTLSCAVDPAIDVAEPQQPVCGCDGVTYPNAAIAARRGVRQSQAGFCGDTLTPCAERSCTSAELCDSVDCNERPTCRTRPTDCPLGEDGGEVCGCDGHWYASGCEAHRAGVSISFDEDSCGARPGPPDAKRFFISAAAYRGAFGGTGAADADCQSEAEAAGLSGVWRAFLGDSRRSAASVLSSSVSGWVDMEGHLVFASREDFVRLQWAHDIAIDGTNVSFRATGESRATHDESVWVGFTEVATSSDSTCFDWTAESGQGGCATFPDGEAFPRAGAFECDCAHYPEKHFVCVEQ